MAFWPNKWMNAELLHDIFELKTLTVKDMFKNSIDMSIWIVFTYFVFQMLKLFSGREIEALILVFLV